MFVWSLWILLGASSAADAIIHFAMLIFDLCCHFWYRAFLGAVHLEHYVLVYFFFCIYILKPGSQMTCDTLFICVSCTEMQYHVINFVAIVLLIGGEVISCGEYSSHLLLWLLWYDQQ